MTERLDQQSASAARRRGGGRPLGTAIRYLIFLGPAALLYVPFVLKPLIETFGLSLFAWNGVSAERTFVGLANYARALGDPIFWISLRNNLYWVVTSIVLPMATGLVIAVLLSAVRRGQRIYAGIFFTPVVLNLIIVGLVWGIIYNPLIGPLNRLLRAVGLGSLAIGWLGDRYAATPAIMVAGAWTFFGFCAVIFLQGLRTLDREQIEAATIDGAGPFRRFRKIIVPALSDQVTLLIVMSIIGSFKVFDIVYVMTKGGPDHASEVIATYMYWQSFMNGSLGYGAALAVMLTAVVAGASLAMMALRERD
ncbi:carbohydrate ABC transporter permease [Pleomorphomonas carboxyditropha]|nr:sugar ABC transporter permease [Pleomorphomonas carboxyditropha]